MGKIQPRKFDRVSHLKEVRYRVAGDGPVLNGNTIDLSPKGVRLFCTNSPPVGESIELVWPNTEPPLLVSGRVVYVKVDVGGNCAGILFNQSISPAVFRQIRQGSASKAGL